MKRFFLLIVVSVFVTSVFAQRTCVIVDMETKLPIKDALIHTNTNHWARTNYTGQFGMVYAFDSATVSKSGYFPKTIYNKELPDTVRLLPEARQLQEVQVWGEDSKHVGDMVKQVTKNLSDYAPRSAGASINLDIMGAFDVQGRRDARHRAKANEISTELDNTGDPIINAYEKTMQELGKESKIKQK